MSYICCQACMGLLQWVQLCCGISALFATVTWHIAHWAGVPNFATLCFQSLTLVSNLGMSADHVGLLAVRVSTLMLLLAGWEVLLVLLWVAQCSQVLSALGFNVVLHLLCGDWPSPWSFSLTTWMSLSFHPALLAADAASSLLEVSVKPGVGVPVCYVLGRIGQ